MIQPSVRRRRARLMLHSLEGRCVPATFVVSSAASEGAGSLREAITQANANPGTDTIAFNLPGPSTIALASTLPALTERVAIDATTQPGYAGVPLVVIDGSGTQDSGLIFRNNNYHSSVRGLSIVGFPRAGIETIMTGSTATDLNGAGAMEIRGNYIGLLPDGITVRGNGTGIHLESVTIASDYNHIGGAGPFEGNVISGNNVGIYSRSWSSVIVGNFIGTTASGNSAAGNAIGIQFRSAFHVIGGANPGEGNLISGNSKIGIDLGGSVEVRVFGNKIGTDVSGSTAVPNGIGISAGSYGASFAKIGSVEPNTGNLIAFNSGAGVLITKNSDFNSVLGNSIHSNGGLGIDFSQTAVADGPTPTGTPAIGYQQPPTILSTASDPTGTVVTGSFVGTPNHNFRIEVYANSEADPSGFGEGQTLLGGFDVVSDAAGSGQFTAIVATAPAGSVISTTLSFYREATPNIEEALETSEFSLAVPLGGAAAPGGVARARLFLDANGNGVRDPGEQGISDVSVFVDLNGNGSVDVGEPEGKSASDGTILFPVSTSGKYTLRTAAISGFTRTTPDSLSVTIAGGATIDVPFGYAPAVVSGGGVVAGRIFADVNGDGKLQSDEVGVGNVRVFVDANANDSYDAGELATVSFPDGTYSLVVGNATARVRIVSPFGFSQTSTNPGPISVPAGTIVHDINFGVRTIASGPLLTGVAFLDMNNNGTKDSGEPGFGNAQIYLDLNNDSKLNPGEPTTASLLSGTFSLQASGTPNAFLRVAPAYGVSVTTSAPFISKSSGTLGGLSFGLRIDTQGGTIVGRAFTDINRNGIVDPGEAGRAGATVYLDYDDDSVLDSNEPRVTTAGDGSYKFQVTDDGSYTVRLIVPGGNIASFGSSAVVMAKGGGDIPVRAFSLTPMTAQPTPMIATGAGAGGGPHVVARNADGTVRFGFFAYAPSFIGGVRVATGDVTGDGAADLICAPGPGGGPHIRIFDGLSGLLVREFYAYSAGFTGGVFVAAGDVDGDGRADVVTGAGAGGGPHVRVFSGKTGAVLQEYYAYTPTYSGGVNVAAGDVTGDGKADVITGTGAGGGPHVRVFDGVTSKVTREFFAYAASFTGGVNVAAGDIDGDRRADIIVGAGQGGGPHVQVYSGANPTVLRSFFAYDVTFTGGVRVGASDLNGDGRADIITGTGPSVPARLRLWNGRATDRFGDIEPYGGFMGGVYVA
ncbi:MAG: FG-GAP-like repeat-containing protein [Gemmataceae bacterium]|nr:FG-GAP-like repeat-containing protein [Gemmataceae bacterium]